jgi:hypothetical protein
LEVALKLGNCVVLVSLNNDRFGLDDRFGDILHFLEPDQDRRLFLIILREGTIIDIILVVKESDPYLSNLSSSILR